MSHPPSIAIVVLNYGGLADTRACLASLQQLDYPKRCLEVFVVDNGSDADEPAGRRDLQATALAEEFPEFAHAPQRGESRVRRWHQRDHGGGAD